MKTFTYLTLISLVLLIVCFLLTGCEAPSHRETQEIAAPVPRAYSSSFLEPPAKISLAQEQSYTLTFTGNATGMPASGDIMFMLDLTGSMGRVLSNAKRNAGNIMSGIQNIFPDATFGIVSHKDYIGSFSGCGSTWENKWGKDGAYTLNSPLTDDISQLERLMKNMQIGHGGDNPESYSRVLYELMHDKEIQWRNGAKKVVVAFLDDIPHDCNVYALIGKQKNTGPDPGRDEIVGTEDDLFFIETIEELKRNNITLITLFNNDEADYLELWSQASKITGGNAYRVNYDGSVIGGGDIADYIVKLMKENLSSINNVSVSSCDPAFESWIKKVDKKKGYSSSGDEFVDQDFDITIEVPGGVAPGIYTLDLCLTGNGAEYARTEVTVIVAEY